MVDAVFWMRQGVVFQPKSVSLTCQGDVFHLKSISLTHLGGVFRLESISLTRRGAVFRLKSIRLTHQGGVFRLKSVSLTRQGTVFQPKSVSAAGRGSRVFPFPVDTSVPEMDSGKFWQESIVGVASATGFHYKQRMKIHLGLAFLTLASVLSAAAPPALPSGVVNSQNPKDTPLAPAEALKKISVPPGFNVTLFAGEPDVMQPIAFDFDDRGRLWVVECFSYPDFKKQDSDRIVIYEDTDGDGRFDQRTVFLENGHRLSGSGSR